ncbi:MAG: hypothetical protein JO318_11875 [Chloroflexi bacterium]|nr:hypothetical protein [Chloroflexota bacterium]
MSQHTLLVGTNGGVFKVVTNGGEPTVQSLGLEQAGGLRCPVVVDCADPRVLFAGTAAMGVLRSDDCGQTWRPSNEGLTKPEVWWLEQHPVTGELWAGTSPAAMFKSDDRGQHWRECEHVQSLPRVSEWTFPNPPHIPHVKHISLRADDPLDILAAVEEGWLIRSRDGGDTWANLTEGTEFDSHTAYFMPRTEARVIVSTSGSGVYRSEDGGSSFGASDAGLDRRYMAQLVVHPARPELVLTAAAAVPPPGWSRPEGAHSAVYRSTDQARSWSRLTGGLPDELSAAPRAVAGDPIDADVMCVGLTDGTVWLTEDGGESFRAAVQMPTQQERGRPSGVTSVRVVHE